jgi:hypothetical protein
MRTINPLLYKQNVKKNIFDDEDETPLCYGAKYMTVVLHVFIDKQTYKTNKAKYKHLICSYKFWTNLILKIDKIEKNPNLMVKKVVFHYDNTILNVIIKEIARLNEEKPRIKVSFHKN